MKQIFIFSDSQKDNISYFEREPAMLVSMNRSDLPYLKEQDFASHTAIYVLIGGNTVSYTHLTLPTKLEV